jgi:hypothetical protein
MDFFLEKKKKKKTVGDRQSEVSIFFLFLFLGFTISILLIFEKYLK